MAGHSETRTYKKEILETEIKILDLERDIENHEIMIEAKKEEINAYLRNIKRLSCIIERRSRIENKTVL